MKQVYQKNDRDCLIISLSLLLNIPYSNIPKFYENYPDNSNNEVMSNKAHTKFKQQFSKWLNDINYLKLNINYNGMLPSVSSNTRCIGILCKGNNFMSHAVVCELKSLKDKYLELSIINDSLKNSTYTIQDLVELQFYYKK